MRNTLRGFASAGAIALCAAGVLGCDSIGLSHPISNDGSCAGSTSPTCTNPGAQVLNLSVISTVLQVGTNQPITASYGGLALNGSGYAVPATFSDSSVIVGGAFGVYALTVGHSSLTAIFNGSQVVLGFDVVANSDGISSIVEPQVYVGSGVQWVPAAPTVQTGWTVQFRATDNTLQTHNVVFDSPPGPVQDVAQGVTASRVFSVPGSYSYHCTLHGETGVINVITPP
jgi:plastocyanin